MGLVVMRGMASSSFRFAMSWMPAVRAACRAVPPAGFESRQTGSKCNASANASASARPSAADEHRGGGGAHEAEGTGLGNRLDGDERPRRGPDDGVDREEVHADLVPCRQR